MLVKDLLNEKGTQLYSINADSSVEAAVDLMSARGTGAVIVMDGKQPIGIFTESDFLKCHLANRHSTFSEFNIAEAMSRNLIVAQPDEDIRQALAMMIKANIHHLPVVQERRITGMLTIHALIKHQVETLTAEIHYLKDYINDLHDAEID